MNDSAIKASVIANIARVSNEHLLTLHSQVSAERAKRRLFSKFRNEDLYVAVDGELTRRIIAAKRMGFKF